MKKNLYFLFIAILFAYGCNLSEDPKLEFSFHLNKMEGFVPSNQIAIWLEKPDGEYVKTFFVCDYLAYGGSAIPDLCPRWVGKAQWSDVPIEIVDAVSQATPNTGEVLFKFDCPANEISTGKYKYFIEIHIAENYNELYTGDIELKEDGDNLISNAVVIHEPEKYSKGNTLLSNVKVNYKD